MIYKESFSLARESLINSQKNSKMEEILNLLKSEVNFNITLKKSDLIDFGKFMISETKAELEAELVAAKAETYLTRLETCDFLKVDQSSLHRWKHRGYLLPVEVGGRRMYRMSDLKRILNGGHEK